MTVLPHLHLPSLKSCKLTILLPRDLSFTQTELEKNERIWTNCMQAVEAQVRQRALSPHVLPHVSFFHWQLFSIWRCFVNWLRIGCSGNTPASIDDFFDFFFLRFHSLLLSGHRNRGIHTIPYEAPAPFMGVGHYALTLDATIFQKKNATRKEGGYRRNGTNLV